MMTKPINGLSKEEPLFQSSKKSVCFYWGRGKCARLNCPFLHTEPPTCSSTPNMQLKRKDPTFSKKDTVCNLWVQGSCYYGDKCRFLHHHDNKVVEGIEDEDVGIPDSPCGKMHEQQVKRVKANWDDEATRIFCEVCVEEVHAGNRPNIHLSNIGWKNVASKFQQRSICSFSKRELKNKWEVLKREYTAWKMRRHKETELVEDHEKDLAEEMDVKSANANVLAFSEGEIKNLTELEVMFCYISSTKPTDASAFKGKSKDEIEVEPGSIGGADDVEYEGQVKLSFEDVKDCDDTIRRQLQQFEADDIGKEKVVSATTQTKTNMGKPSEIGSAVFTNSELNCIVGATDNPQTSITDKSRCSIADCLSLLSTIPRVEIGSELYMLGTRLFIKREYREMFVALPNVNVRAAWLKQELQREQTTFCHSNFY